MILNNFYNLNSNIVNTGNNNALNLVGIQNNLQSQIINLQTKMDKIRDYQFKLEPGQVYKNVKWKNTEALMTITEIIEDELSLIRFRNEDVINNGIGIYDRTSNTITLHIRNDSRSAQDISICNIINSDTFQGSRHLLGNVLEDWIYIVAWVRQK